MAKVVKVLVLDGTESDELLRSLISALENIKPHSYELTREGEVVGYFFSKDALDIMNDEEKAELIRRFGEFDEIYLAG